MRWTVDEAEDFDFVTEVYKNLYPSKANFNMDDILVLLNNRPDIVAINDLFSRNEGFNKSLKADEAFLSNIKKEN
jgi:spore coat polysaccharide biosynthesis protein SpsF